MHTVGSDSGGVSYLFGLDRNVSSASWRRPLSRSRVQLHAEERKGTVKDQEAAPGSAGPSNSGELASGSGDTTKPTSISLPEDVISTVFEKTGPIVESCWVARCMKLCLISLTLALHQSLNVSAPEPLCLSSLAATCKTPSGNSATTCRSCKYRTYCNIFMLKTDVLWWKACWQRFCSSLELLKPLAEMMMITQHLNCFKPKTKKELFRRINPPLLMCAFID